MTTETKGGASGRLLLPHHRELLEAGSAINPDVITERGYYSIQTRKELKTAGGSATYADHLPAIGIPIYSPTGAHVYDLVRYDDAPTVDGARRKYLLPWRAQSRLDVPARVRGALQDPSVALYVTEGSKKVDALISAGLPAVGLTGVWSWRGTNDKGGKAVIADLDEVAMNDREIHLIFDSDVMTKEAVYIALSRFREVIQNRGATAILYYLPGHVTDGEIQKVGIDDWIAAGRDIGELVHHATRELRPPPGKETPAGDGEPEARATVQHPPALAFRPDLLAALTQGLRQLGHVGEERIAKLIYLAVTSRLLTKIVSVVVKGTSSAGKSSTVERTLRFIPDDAVITLTGMSEHFLAYDTRPIQHKMLVLFEASGMSGEHATYLIRTLLSEGVIEHGTVESLPDGLQSKVVAREGPTGLITTTTQVTLHPENETRLLSITADDSTEQTRRVIDAVAAHDEDDDQAPDFDEWHTLQHWLEDGPRRVEIPYARELAALIPPVATRLRRDIGTLLALVRAHALLHRASRDVRDGRVIAELDDYRVVRDLVANIISDTLGQSVSKATREIVATVDELLEADAKIAVRVGHVTYATLVAELGLDKSAVSRRARVAVTGGYLRNQEDKRGKPARLVLGDPLPEDIAVLPTVDEVEGCCSVAPHLGPTPTPTVSLTPNGDGTDLELQPATCAYPGHRASDYYLPGGSRWICGICHPPVPSPKEAG